MEEAFINGDPRALQLSQDLDELIVIEQNKLTKEGNNGKMVRPQENANS